MQITNDELRQHYAALSDEMLEEIDPSDLTKVAREYYEREIEKRTLAAETVTRLVDEDVVEEEPEEGLEVDPDWLEHAACVCSYQATPGSNHAADAARAQDVLLAAGVPCHLSLVKPDRQSADVPLFDEYQVLVPASLNLKAISVLDEEIFNADLEADWRTHFAALSDEELRALKPEAICAGLLDRVQRLTRAYNDEIARRGSK